MLMDVYNKPKDNSLYNSILHKKIPELTGPNEASYFIKPQTNKLRSAVRGTRPAMLRVQLFLLFILSSFLQTWFAACNAVIAFF